MRKAAFGWVTLGVAGALLTFTVVHAQQSLPPHLRGPALAGPNLEQLQRGQNDYVMRNCHFCHGPTLADARGGGADLGHSQLIANDRGGDMIGVVVRAGTPRTQTAMPRYPDISDGEISDIAAYVHYMRQALHEREVTQAPTAVGDPEAGKAYFIENCAACHTGAKSLGLIAATLDDKTLAARIVRPAPASLTAAATASGRDAHLHLLEQERPADVRNIIAFLHASGGKVSPGEVKAFQAAGVPIAHRFEQQCGMCHGNNGEGSLRAPAVRGNPEVVALGEDGVKAFITQGSPGGMPAFKMSPARLDAYTKWITGETHDRP